VEALLGNTQNLCVLEEEDNQTSMRVLTIPCYFSPVGSVEQIPDPSELTVQVTTNVLNFNSSKPMTVKVSLKNPRRKITFFNNKILLIFWGILSNF
jgi:hypothetical protein